MGRIRYCLWDVPEERRHCEYCLWRHCELYTRAKQPPVDEVGRYYLDVMSEIMGESVGVRSRRSNLTWGRYMVAYQLRQDGFSLVEIGRVLQKNHSSIINGLKKMDNMLDYPWAHKLEISFWERFQKELSLRKKYGYVEENSETVVVLH